MGKFAELEVLKLADEGTCTHCGRPNFMWEGKEVVSELFEARLGSGMSRQQVILCRNCLEELIRKSTIVLD